LAQGLQGAVLKSLLAHMAGARFPADGATTQILLHLSMWTTEKGAKKDFLLAWLLSNTRVSSPARFAIGKEVWKLLSTKPSQQVATYYEFEESSKYAENLVALITENRRWGKNGSFAKGILKFLTEYRVFNFLNAKHI